jgi:hypothetical protein
MKETFPIHLSMGVFKALGKHVGDMWYSERMERALETAVLEWIERQKTIGDCGAQKPTVRGYQWKQLFLPEGTLLRTVLGGSSHDAVVTGGHIIFNGNSITPSEFANCIGAQRRSAWHALWLLFPGESEWKSADALRR